MKTFIDTNLFVYATYSSFPTHEKARAFLERCRQEGSCFISWSVIYEYLAVVTQPTLFKNKTLSSKLALENILSFADGRVEILVETTEHPKILQEVQKKHLQLQGRLFYDAHHYVMMQEYDIKTIYTADIDFHRFANIKVINPVKE